MSLDEQAQSLAQAAELFDKADVALGVIGPGGRVERVNDAWCELFGDDARVSAFGAGPPRLVSAIGEVAATGSPVSLEHIRYRTEPSLGFCRVWVAPRRGRLAAPGSVVLAAADSTEDLFGDAAVAHASDAIWTMDLFGSCDAGVPAGPWLERIHPRDVGRCRDAVKDVAGPSGRTTLTARLRGRDGRYRWHDIQLVRLADEARIAGVATDVHDAHQADRATGSIQAKAAQRKAHREDRLKDRFLAAVSHELRSPLATMMLWETVLRDNSASPELRQRALDAIHQSAATQCRLVGDLLDMTRAKRGKLFIDPHPTDLTSVLQQAAEAFAPAMRAKSLTLRTSFDASPCRVDADAVRMRQVFDNLLSNAVKFTDAGGTIYVTARNAPGMFEVEVRDTGRGITRPFLAQVFDRFSQFDEQVTRAEGGLGLGLAISRELVTLHHGKITVASDGVGKGTSFTVALPVVKTLARTSPAAEGAEDLSGCRVLVIDDDVRLGDALCALLGRVGAAVTSVPSADAARDVLTKSAFDVLICDIGMPHEDGYAFLRRQREAGDHTPAIALTAYASLGDERTAMSMGFHLHVGKPVDFERLVSCIHSAIAT